MPSTTDKGNATPQRQHTPTPWEADGPYNWRPGTFTVYILQSGHEIAQVHSDNADIAERIAAACRGIVS